MPWLQFNSSALTFLLFAKPTFAKPIWIQFKHFCNNPLEKKAFLWVTEVINLTDLSKIFTAHHNPKQKWHVVNSKHSLLAYILFCQDNTKQKRYLLFDFYIVLPFQNEGHCLHDLLPMSAHYVVYVLPKQGWNTFSVTPQTRKGHSCLNHSKWGLATLHTELPNQELITAETLQNILLHVEPAFVWEHHMGLGGAFPVTWRTDTAVPVARLRPESCWLRL